MYVLMTSIGLTVFILTRQIYYMIVPLVPISYHAGPVDLKGGGEMLAGSPNGGTLAGTLN